jgi:mono/diheme cytochrome c family protein
MINFRPLARVLSLALLVISLSACSFSLAEDIKPPENAMQPVSVSTETVIEGPVYPLVPPNPQAGEALFVENCAPCHGEAGLGDGPQAAKLSIPVGAIGLPEVSRLGTPSDWFTLITEGDLERHMYPFRSLTDRQRWDVVAYTISLSDEAEDVALGEALYQDNCASCHGEAGKGDGAAASGLMPPPTNFTDQATMAERSTESLYQSIANGKGSMPAYGKVFSEAENRALAAFVRKLSFASTAPAAEAAVTEVAMNNEPATPAVTTTITSTVPVTVTVPLTTTLPVTSTLATVMVQVTNASGSALPEDLSATLYAFDNMMFTFSQTLTSHVSGLFAFENLEILPERVFIANVDYQATTYSSDVFTVENPELPIALPITVYDNATDISGLVVDRIHIFFDFSVEGTVQVVELFIVSNPTNATIVAKEAGGGVLTYQLPSGFTSLQFEDGALGERYLEVPGGFMDTQSIPPGASEYQIVFAFNLPYERKLKFEQVLELGTNASVVLLPDVGVDVNAPGLVGAGSREVEGITYLMYNGGVLPANSTLTIELSGSPAQQEAAATGGTDQRTNLLVGLGALGLVLVAAGAWLYRRNQSDDDEEDEEEDEETPALPDDPDELMDAIIALDDLYREGKLPEEAYQTRRQELRSRLEKLDHI